MPWEKQFNEEAVLEKAMIAFWEKGYANTSLADLVERTGIGRGSLYATYHDKHELFLAALRLYDDRNRKRVLAELESRNGPREAVLKMFRGFLEATGDGAPSRGCFLTNTALELAARDPEAAAIVTESQQQIEAFFGRMIRRGQAEGQFRRDLPVADTARGLLASLIGLIVLTRSQPRRTLLESVVDDAMRRLQ